MHFEIVAREESVGSICGKPNHATSASSHPCTMNYCLTCDLERELAEANKRLAKLAAVESWLRHIQQSVATSRWQTVGDFYRGKQVFLPQDLLNLMDTALDGL